MRLLFGIVLCLFSYLAIPGDLGIVTLTQQDKTIFLVKVGAFAQQSAADAYLKKLSSQVKQPISIQHDAASGFIYRTNRPPF